MGNRKRTRSWYFGHLCCGCGKCSYLRMPWDFWLILAVLAVVLPLRGRARMKKVLAMPRVRSMERLVVYASTIAFQWLAIAIFASSARAERYTVAELRFWFTC